MKKLLIVGAGIEQIPAIKIAREMGYYVVVTDILENAPGTKFANKNYVVSTNDYEKNLNVSINENIDGIMTLCSETAIPVIAKISDKLGLPGISEETALAATNKGVMREEMIKCGIEMSAFNIATTVNQALSFAKSCPPPWVIKPSDSSGQRGTTFTSNINEIPKAFEFAKQYANDDAVLLDQFVQGPEINVTAMINKGNITFLSLSNRVTLDAPNFGIAVRHIAPVHLKISEQQLIKEMSMKAIKAIGLENGIAYPQIIMSPEGPKFIEIAARIPGGHMREMGMHLSGIDMIKTSIWQALGESLNNLNIKTEQSYSSVSIKFITSKNINTSIEVVNEITGIDKALMTNGIKTCYIRLKIGHKVPKLENSIGRFGAIIAVGESKKETLELIKKVFENIKINNLNLIEYQNYNKYNNTILKF